MSMKRCCICKKIIISYGNDPWPVNKEEGAQCCNKCNIEVVVPARLRELADKEKNR